MLPLKATVTKTDQTYFDIMNNENKITVVMYHYVRDLANSRYPRIKGLSVEHFKGQLDYLSRHYNFVRIEDIIDAYNGIGKLPPHPVLLTLDDAYADHFNNVFPILKHRGIQGCFYPPVKAITEHTVLDVNKIHFILASTEDKDLPALLIEIKLLLDKYRDEYNLKSFDEYYKVSQIA